MREIQLTQGYIALVDDEDYEFLSQWKWYAKRGTKNKTPYAVRNFSYTSSNSHRVTLKMHNVIWEYHNRPISEGLEIDHQNRNGLDNQKENFRLATRAQQLQNQGVKNTNTSGFIGVSFNKGRGKPYIAQIQVNGIKLSLGYFDDPIEAAHVRDEAAVKYFGEFAQLNFPGPLHQPGCQALMGPTS